jgi:hypothetical protein
MHYNHASNHHHTPPLTAPDHDAPLHYSFTHDEAPTPTHHHETHLLPRKPGSTLPS